MNDHEIYPMPFFVSIMVKDVEKSKYFYVNLLDFILVFSMPNNKVAHIRFTKYADMLLVEKGEGDDGTNNNNIKLNFSLPLAGRKINEIEAIARENGALVEGPIERPWNVTEVTIKDPDGYLLVFSEPINTKLSFDEVVGRMDTPK